MLRFENLGWTLTEMHLEIVLSPFCLSSSVKLTLPQSPPVRNFPKQK